MQTSLCLSVFNSVHTVPAGEEGVAVHVILAALLVVVGAALLLIGVVQDANMLGDYADTLW